MPSIASYFNRQKNMSSPVADSTKRALSSTTSPDPHDAKKRELSLSEVAATFEEDTPFWVPLVLKAVDKTQQDIAAVLTKMDDMSASQAAISKKVADLEKTVKFVGDKFDEQAVELTEVRSSLSKMEKAHATLLGDFVKLRRQVDGNEQHSRNECLVVHGVAEQEEEVKRDHRKLFADTVTNNVGLELKSEELRRAHRLGPPRQDGKPRPIIARFNDMYTRNKVYGSKRNLKGKKIVLTENLTARRLGIMNEGRDKYGNKNVWSQEGRIMANDGHKKIVLCD